MIFAYLGDIHASRHQTAGRKTDLDEAVSATRLAISISTADNPMSTTLLNNLGNLLLRRYNNHTSHEDDLHQALEYVLRAGDFLQRKREQKHAPSVLATLGAIRACLYDRMGDVRDLEEAILKTRNSIRLAADSAITTRGTLFNNLGSLLCRRYQLTGKGEDQDESIVSFVRALECFPEDTREMVTCLINSSLVLTQRYGRTGQLDDLGRALHYTQKAMQLDPDNGDLVSLLKDLDGFLNRRRKTAGLYSHWPRPAKAPKLLLMLSSLLALIEPYLYSIITGALLILGAFLGGIFYNRMIDWHAVQGKRFSMGYSMSHFWNPQYHRFPRSSVSAGRSEKFMPKLLDVPLIEVPFASSLRGTQPSAGLREPSHPKSESISFTRRYPQPRKRKADQCSNGNYKVCEGKS